MISVLSKPANQIGSADIQELIDSQVPEGEQIEFKESLTTGDGSPDRWVTQGDRIGRRAKNKILEESAAFANAYGGTLVLGIAEADTRPPVAAKISPIPLCMELGERLKLVFRDGVEPQIPSLEIFAVETDGNNGVVIIRTGKSRMAPHRVKPTRECTIRRGDRCEKMSMREIQELTLNASRGLELLEQRLSVRANTFRDEFRRLREPRAAYGIRVTAVPVVDEIRLRRVFRRTDLFPPNVSTSLANSSELDSSVNFPAHPRIWRPRLRYARSEYGDDGSYKKKPEVGHDHIYWEMHCDGTVEIGFLSCADVEGTPFRLYPDWPVHMLATAGSWANKVKKVCSTPALEYAIEIEIQSIGRNLPVASGYRSSDAVAVNDEIGELVQGSVKFPRYSLTESSEVIVILANFECDFWNSMGIDFGLNESVFSVT